MKIERDIEKKIKQKEEEVQRLKEEMYKAKSYLEGLQDSLRLIKKTSNVSNGGGVRPGSMVDKARKAILRAGKPLHVGELLRSMGKEITKKTKASLSGSLGTYVRDNFIFTRTGPNTFGLIEFDEHVEGEPPEDFGLDTN